MSPFSTREIQSVFDPVFQFILPWQLDWVCWDFLGITLLCQLMPLLTGKASLTLREIMPNFSCSFHIKAEKSWQLTWMTWELPGALPEYWCFVCPFWLFFGTYDARILPAADIEPFSQLCVWSQAQFRIDFQAALLLLKTAEIVLM